MNELFFDFILGTFGVESVVITDISSHGRVCLECIFSSFSTDSGCRVELSASTDSIVQYTETFNRLSSANSTGASGCISVDRAGQYTVRVYDEGSSVVADSLVVGLLCTMKETMIISIDVQWLLVVLW